MFTGGGTNLAAQSCDFLFCFVTRGKCHEYEGKFTAKEGMRLQASTERSCLMDKDHMTPKASKMEARVETDASD